MTATQLSLPLVREIVSLHEEIIKSARTALDKAIRIGELLTQQKAALKHGEWLPWVKENLPFDRRTATNYMSVYAKREIVSHLDSPTDAYRLLSEGGKDTVATKFTGDQESYTPKEYLEAARAVLGRIDLDPASNDEAQKTVKASKFFTSEEDGLLQDWAGTIFLNPPYTAGLIDQFVEKLAASFEAGKVKSAILLTNDNTDTGWFHRAATSASAFCLLRGRINFYKGDGSTTSPTNGQTFFYFGKSETAFSKAFSQFGLICRVL